MIKPKIPKALEKAAMVTLSVIIGSRIFNEFLKYNDTPQGEYTYSVRELSTGEKLRVSHGSNYDITSSGKDTIVFISDSFGEGAKCGNKQNIAGCLENISGKKVVNLSKGGTSPGFYLMQLKKYLADARKLNPMVRGETIAVSLYSNDIVLLKDNCRYFRDNSRYLSAKVDEIQFDYLEEKCSNILNMTNIEYQKLLNFSLPISGFLKGTIGSYSYAVLKEFTAQATLTLGLNTTIGRAGYIPKWGGSGSPERSLLLEILKEIESTCNLYTCNVVFATFPNVEDLSRDSFTRKSLASFINYASNSKTKILDGYVPFLEKGIKNASYSLTDVHSDCDGYKTYANWLWSNINHNR